jgi:predicted RNase H-like nuclease (RuvC/YqgF family)
VKKSTDRAFQKAHEMVVSLTQDLQTALDNLESAYTVNAALRKRIGEHVKFHLELSAELRNARKKIERLERQLCQNKKASMN